MSYSTPAFSGVVDSLRRLADDLLGALKERVELVGLEVEEEKIRLVRTIIWVCAAAFSSMMAAAFLSMTLVFLAPERLRPAVLLGLSAFYILAACWIIAKLRRRLQNAPKAFAATVAELGRDRSCLDPHLEA